MAYQRGAGTTDQELSKVQSLLEILHPVILNLGETVADLESRMKTGEEMLHRLDEDVYNHGKEGLKTVMMKFMNTVATQEAERQRTLLAQQQTVKDALEDHSTKQAIRSNWTMVLLTAMLVLLAYMGLTNHIHL